MTREEFQRIWDKSYREVVKPEIDALMAELDRIEASRRTPAAAPAQAVARAVGQEELNAVVARAMQPILDRLNGGTTTTARAVGFQARTNDFIQRAQANAQRLNIPLDRAISNLFHEERGFGSEYYRAMGSGAGGIIARQSKTSPTGNKQAGELMTAALAVAERYGISLGDAMIAVANGKENRDFYSSYRRNILAAR